MQENNKTWNNIGAFPGSVSVTSFNTLNLLWGTFIEHFPINKWGWLRQTLMKFNISHIFRINFKVFWSGSCFNKIRHQRKTKHPRLSFEGQNKNVNGCYNCSTSKRRVLASIYVAVLMLRGVLFFIYAFHSSQDANPPLKPPELVKQRRGSAFRQVQGVISKNKHLVLLLRVIFQKTEVTTFYRNRKCYSTFQKEEELLPAHIFYLIPEHNKVQQMSKILF